MRGPVPPLIGMERVEALKILGVWIFSKLNVTTRVDEVFTSCSGNFWSLYVLHILRAHGLDELSLRTVCKSTTINPILCAGPAWWGCADEADRTRIGRFMRRLLKAGFTGANNARHRCFNQLSRTQTAQPVQSNEFHVLRSLFPSLAQHKHFLRRRVHL